MKAAFVFLNGKFVPKERAVVSVFDRSFLYGDGLFEAVRIRNGRPFRWAQHWERFRRGADFLKIKIPFTSGALCGFAARLIAKNKMPDALLRLTLSRGVGERGYSPRGANSPTLVMSLHPAPKLDLKNPPRWRLVTSSVRLRAGDPLARFKTANKLAQIIARAEADDAGADEALVLDSRGCVAEATSANIFWIARGAVCTPPLRAGILPGVTREAVLELCRRLKISTREKEIFPAQLRDAGGLFLSLASRGVVEISSLDGRKIKPSPLAKKLRRAYAELLNEETAKP